MLLATKRLSKLKREVDLEHRHFHKKVDHYYSFVVEFNVTAARCLRRVIVIVSTNIIPLNMQSRAACQVGGRDECTITIITVHAGTPRRRPKALFILPERERSSIKVSTSRVR